MAHEPLWRTIQRGLADEIEREVHRPGERLPPEQRLAQRFGVNRHTVRRAMAALQDDGLVRIEQGRGTYVQEALIDYPVAKRTRFSEIMIGADRDPDTAPLRTMEVPAPAGAARELVVAEGVPVWLIETVHMADGRPLSVTAHYFARPRFDGIVEAFREAGSITQALYGLGVRDYFRDITRVTTRLPDHWEARHLRQPRTQPVLVAESVNVDPEGRPIEYALGCCAGQRAQLVFQPK